MNTTIAELTELAADLNALGNAHLQLQLSAGNWTAKIHTRPITHEHVDLFYTPQGTASFGLIRATSASLHAAVNLAASKARIVLAAQGVAA